MMGHPYAQSWRAIMRAEVKRRSRAWAWRIGAVAFGAVGLVVSWPW